jgi:hypothetical protein
MDSARQRALAEAMMPPRGAEGPPDREQVEIALPRLKVPLSEEIMTMRGERRMMYCFDLTKRDIRPENTAWYNRAEVLTRLETSYRLCKQDGPPCQTGRGIAVRSTKYLDISFATLRGR